MFISMNKYVLLFNLLRFPYKMIILYPKSAVLQTDKNEQIIIYRSKNYAIFKKNGAVWGKYFLRIT